MSQWDVSTMNSIISQISLQYFVAVEGCWLRRIGPTWVDLSHRYEAQKGSERRKLHSYLVLSESIVEEMDLKLNHLLLRAKPRYPIISISFLLVLEGAL